MITCEICRDLIEQYIDGTIGDTKLEELKAHAETCDTCRDEFERCRLMQDVVKAAFIGGISAEAGKEAVMAKLSGAAGVVRIGSNWTRRAVAAGILLAVGLGIGFVVGKSNSGRGGVKLAAEVPVRVGNLNGTVLVRHAGMEVWDTLQEDSTIRIGDKFHSAAKSDFSLLLDEKSTVQLNQNSMLVLKSYNGRTQFFLEYGECTAALESPHGPFFIDTPNGRVEALGTEFTVKVE
ncbi:MAG: FecR domain-containing protein [Sedimentisphaerales bacterium]|nr:FecR domain-containing protein [Sedimentisphaerales bacterium]